MSLMLTQINSNQIANSKLLTEIDAIRGKYVDRPDFSIISL